MWDDNFEEQPVSNSRYSIFYKLIKVLTFLLLFVVIVYGLFRIEQYSTAFKNEVRYNEIGSVIYKARFDESFGATFAAVTNKGELYVGKEVELSENAGNPYCSIIRHLTSNQVLDLKNFVDDGEINKCYDYLKDIVYNE